MTRLSRYKKGNSKTKSVKTVLKARIKLKINPFAKSTKSELMLSTLNIKTPLKSETGPVTKGMITSAPVQ